MTKPRLNFEEHQQLGDRLRDIRDELVHLNVQLANAYPRSGPESAPATELEAAHEAVDRARRGLERALYDEHPRWAATSVYFSRREN
ncbi:hypothetical protein YUMDRAFT_06090 [Streptomyces sp. OspMP-M45]|nr:hypothetical protein YUMDRAFT_06090 [Streptomyces sp. OspMP-M45]